MIVVFRYLKRTIMQMREYTLFSCPRGQDQNQYIENTKKLRCRLDIYLKNLHFLHMKLPRSTRRHVKHC